MVRTGTVEVKFKEDATVNGLYVEPEPTLGPGAPVITVHRGEVLVGAWEEDGFVHPASQRELAREAAELLMAHVPSIDLQTQLLRVFTCPRMLADKHDWDWSSGPDAR